MEFIKTLFQLFNYLFQSAFVFSPFILLFTSLGAACSLVVSLLAFASEDSVREPLSVAELLPV